MLESVLYHRAYCLPGIPSSLVLVINADTNIGNQYRPLPFAFPDLPGGLAAQGFCSRQAVEPAEADELVRLPHHDDHEGALARYHRVFPSVYPWQHLFKGKVCLRRPWEVGGVAEVSHESLAVGRDRGADGQAGASD